MITLACIIGRHKWKYTEPEYGSATEERLGLARRGAFRKCSKCGKIQKDSSLYIHLKDRRFK